MLKKEFQQIPASLIVLTRYFLGYCCRQRFFLGHAVLSSRLFGRLFLPGERNHLYILVDHIDRRHVFKEYSGSDFIVGIQIGIFLLTAILFI